MRDHSTASMSLPSGSRLSAPLSLRAERSVLLQLRLVTQSLYFGVQEAGKLDSSMSKHCALAWFDAAQTSTSVVSSPDARASWKAAFGRARSFLASK